MDEPRSDDLAGTMADSGLTDGRKAQRRFWTQFLRDGSSTLSELRRRTPAADNWMTFGIGRTDIELFAVHARGATNGLKLFDHLRIELIMRGANGESHYRQLHDRKADIESCLGPGPITWYGPGGVFDCRIYVSKDAPIRDPDHWRSQHEWLLTWLQKFDDVFRPIVQDLDA